MYNMYQPQNSIPQYPPNYNQAPPSYPQNYSQEPQYGQPQYQYGQQMQYPAQWVCRNCGACNAPDANFCPHCGTGKE